MQKCRKQDTARSLVGKSQIKPKDKGQYKGNKMRIKDVCKTKHQGAGQNDLQAISKNFPIPAKNVCPENDLLCKCRKNRIKDGQH